MYDRYSYKIKFFLIYLFAAVIAISIVAFSFKLSKENDITTITNQHIKNASNAKNTYLNQFLNTYKSTLRAISTDKYFEIFLNTNKNKELIQNYFLSIHKSLPYVSQIRYINIEGKEIIRTNSFKEKVSLAAEKELQNKISRYYIKEFLSLKEAKIGISRIDLNLEQGKIVEPKELTIRLGMAVFDNKGIKKGLIILNILLSPFLENLEQTNLYNISLIDSEGKFLFHYNKKYGILSEDNNYTLKDEFPNDWENILTKPEHLTNKYYSFFLDAFENQNIKMVLKAKYLDTFIENENIKKNLIVILIFIALLFTPLVLYFANLPDKLAKEFLNEHVNDNITGFPNKLTLIEDLKTKKYKDHVILIVQLNNIFKIQNTYGYKISDKLIRLFTKFLSEYKGIDNLYVKNYNNFALMYKYTDNKELKNFLDNFQNDLERKQFTIDGENVEFLLNTTIGISNPKDISENKIKLQQAENALEMALDNRKSMDIYGAVHERNIDYKKQNINLAFNIKKYIEADKVLVYFQPIFNNFTEKIEKYECLVRIQSDSGILYPDTFLPLAKEINQYNRLSYIIVNKAFEFFKDKNYEFSINLSIIDLYDLKFQDFLFEKIKEYGVENRLVIEIVESESINNYEIFFDFAKKIKQIGSKIAIDDFGSGYSNFNYIIQLSEYIDYLKIDGSLVKDIVNSHKIQILIGSLKFLSDNLEIQTIAEYVEDKEVLRYLSSIGVDYSQGYYIGKPKPKLLDD